MPQPRHYNAPHRCETPGGVAVGISEWLGATVIYVSATGREWDAIVTSTHENGYNKDPKANQLPLVCLEFRNERGKINRKHKVLPWGWAYWCKPHNYFQVWKPKSGCSEAANAPAPKEAGDRRFESDHLDHTKAPNGEVSDRAERGSLD